MDIAALHPPYTLVVFARILLRAPEDICARNVMVDADFITAQTAEELFRPVRAGTIQRTGFLVADRFDFKTLMQIFPWLGFQPCVEVPAASPWQYGCE
jgi:hypothetical protein